MALSTSIPADELLHELRRSGNAAIQPVSRASAVSWGSIAAGAAAAAPLALILLILLILGVGLGLSSVSPMAARDAADKARKASAYSALWLFVSLLTGAFVASLAATYGGRRRDA